MFKKMGVVTVGVAAGLLAAAPFASATECSHDSDHHESHSSSDNDCNVTGGEATANGDISGDSLANTLAQAPVGGSNLLNLTCTNILNDNVSGNHLTVNL
ncbi:hypothetical protein GCM10023200_42130 [Actinomycetospora chlora]|uniref:Secreted protein n=1 Tax=Actinomycetospora chlora TaxID=663608 RepID=A0ABP9BXX7_9PSEU